MYIKVKFGRQPLPSVLTVSLFGALSVSTSDKGHVVPHHDFRPILRRMILRVFIPRYIQVGDSADKGHYVYQGCNSIDIYDLRWDRGHLQASVQEYEARPVQTWWGTSLQYLLNCTSDRGLHARQVPPPREEVLAVPRPPQRGMFTRRGSFKISGFKGIVICEQVDVKYSGNRL